MSTPDPYGDIYDIAETTPVEVATWAPLDLSAVLAGDYQPPVPTLLQTDDGASLLYPGLIHSIMGESESGKSMIIQAEVARLINQGDIVVYVDFESDAPAVIDRLRMFGARDTAIAGNLRYVRPELPPGASHVERTALDGLMTFPCSLVVLDGVTEALALFGVSSMDNDDVTSWGRTFLRPLAAGTGAAVVMIDHVVKDTKGRGRFAIGAQAKMAFITGASYIVDVYTPLARGVRGELVIKVGKDRPGYVRQLGGVAEHGTRLQEVARWTLDATDPDYTEVVFRSFQADKPTDTFRPTILMQRISEALQTADRDMSKAEVLSSVKGTRQHLFAAVDALVSEGYVSTYESPRERARPAVMLHLETPFTA